MPTSSELGTLLQFTPDDLDLNRQGKLSSGQIARLEVALRRQRDASLVLLGAIAILAIMIFVIFSIFGESVIGFFLSAITVVVLIGAAGYQGYAYIRARRKFAQGSVSTACGKVSAFKSRRSPNFPYEYYVRVQNVQFDVLEKSFEAFHNGHSFAVYYVPLMRPTIVAAEEIT